MLDGIDARLLRISHSKLLVHAALVAPNGIATRGLLLFGYTFQECRRQSPGRSQLPAAWLQTERRPVRRTEAMTNTED